MGVGNEIGVNPSRPKPTFFCGPLPLGHDRRALLNGGKKALSFDDAIALQGRQDKLGEPGPSLR